MTKNIRLAILVAGQDRADLAVAELWRTARTAVPENIQLQGTAVYAAGPGATVPGDEEFLEVVSLGIPDEGPADRFADRLAAKTGAAGVLGRLLQHNLRSHKVARALAKDKRLTGTFCAADMVVSADPLADWAIWSLRKKSAAPLIHGPFAMSNALAEMANK